MKKPEVISGLSRPKELDHGWKPFGALVERTDDYRIVISEEEELQDLVVHKMNPGNEW
jgi:hypothetical protein